MPHAREAFNLAAFFDLENLAIGVREVDYPEFDVQLVLGRLIEKVLGSVFSFGGGRIALTLIQQGFNVTGIETVVGGSR